MSKTKVEVLNSVVGGAKRGEQIEIDSKSARHLSSIGYVKVIEQEKKAVEQAVEKPKAKRQKKG